MKLFLTILAGMSLFLPSAGLRAGAKTGSINPVNVTQTNAPPSAGGKVELPFSLFDRMTQQQNQPAAFLNGHTSFKSRLGKTDTHHSQIYVPDSLILYAMNDTIRMIATYDQRGWNTQILAQVWLYGNWVNYTRKTWTYLDSNGRNLTLSQNWSNGQWINTELDSSSYDSRGNMLVHLFKYWRQGAWQDSILSSRTYDANGNMLANIGWYMINNQWTNHDRSLYTYDSTGHELTFLFQEWSGQWVNSEQRIYTYDPNGHMLTALMQVWNTQWENATLSTYTYDAYGNTSSFLMQVIANGQWTNFTIDTYTYNASGDMLTDWYKGWTNGSWMNGSFYTYTYDPNGNLLNVLLQYWLNGFWTNSRQSTFTYDAHGNELTGNNTTWSGSAWVSADNTFYLEVAGSSYSFTGYRIIISWRLVTTDVPMEGGSIARNYSLSQNYPNPFNPSTTISFSLPSKSYVTLKVFDILGKEIATIVSEELSAGNYSRQWNASGMSSGVYFYRLQAGKYLETKKLILLR